MSLQKEIMALTKEQKAKLAGVRNEQELIDAISEAGIELTDEEVSKVAGGGNMLDWRCDRGIYELVYKEWLPQCYGICESCPLYFETAQKKYGNIYVSTFYCDFLGWTRECFAKRK